MKMKWKFFLFMIGLSLTLAVLNTYMINIPLLVMLAPLIIGTIVISVSSLIQIGIVIIVWILFMVLVLGKGMTLI